MPVARLGLQNYLFGRLLYLEAHEPCCSSGPEGSVACGEVGPIWTP